MKGHIRKKLYGNREIVVKWTVGVWEHTDSWLGAHMGSVLKRIQTLKEYFWCHVYCAHLGTPWYRIVGACRTVCNRESRYPHREWSRERESTKIKREICIPSYDHSVCVSTYMVLKNREKSENLRRLRRLFVGMITLYAIDYIVIKNREKYVGWRGLSRLWSLCMRIDIYSNWK